MRRSFVLCAVAVLGLAGEAWAQSPVLQGDGSTRSAVCSNADAVVSGNRNKITFTGSCTGLQIRGEGNVVSVVLAAHALIDIEGGRNRVRYTAAADAAPRLRILGDSTEIIPGPNAAAPEADTATLSGDALNIVLDCGGKTVTLQSTGSRIRLRGACSALTVRGEANTIRADLAPKASVLVEGNAISLIYTIPGADPAATVRGMGSVVARDGSLAAAIAPDDSAGIASVPVPVLMHALDAIVMPTGTAVKLPAAVFNATGLSPAGEIQMARLGALIGQINPTGLTVTGHDPDQTQAGTRADLVAGWLTSHGKQGLPTQASGGDAGDAAVDVMILR